MCPQYEDLQKLEERIAELRAYAKCLGDDEEIATVTNTLIELEERYAIAQKNLRRNKDAFKG